jgi:GWxTD domain-containing protein
MKRKIAILLLLFPVGAGVGCGSWQRVGADRTPTPATVVPGLFEPSGAYREMGFLAQGTPVPFVGAARFFAGPAPESTLVLFSLSLVNSALSFQRAGGSFQARYRVEAVFRSDSATRQLASDQTVRVSSFSETQRSDESVIFQQYVLAPPGQTTIVVVVRDQNTGGFSRDERSILVPRLTSPAASSVVAFYKGTGRSARSQKPDLVANPRATVPYGADTLNLYVEAYGVGDSALTLRALDEGDNEVWRAVPPLPGDTAFRTAVVRLPPGVLPIGRLTIEATLGTSDTVRAPVLVGFSDQWVVANFEGVLNLLRYFGAESAIQGMHAAPDSARADLWRKFWRDTDPDPSTPENEALQQYFSRLQAANTRFREGTDPGWLTDRGEVFVSLGEPDEVFDQSSDLQGQRRFIRWTYTRDRLVLDFVDTSGFGRFRLSSSSRADFQRVVARVRRRD